MNLCFGLYLPCFFQDFSFLLHSSISYSWLNFETTSLPSTESLSLLGLFRSSSLRRFCIFLFWPFLLRVKFVFCSAPEDLFIPATFSLLHLSTAAMCRKELHLPLIFFLIGFNENPFIWSMICEFLSSFFYSGGQSLLSSLSLFAELQSLGAFFFKISQLYALCFSNKDQQAESHVNVQRTHSSLQSLSTLFTVNHFA